MHNHGSRRWLRGDEKKQREALKPGFLNEGWSRSSRVHPSGAGCQGGSGEIFSYTSLLEIKSMKYLNPLWSYFVRWKCWQSGEDPRMEPWGTPVFMLAVCKDGCVQVWGLKLYLSVHQRGRGGIPRWQREQYLPPSEIPDGPPLHQVGSTPEHLEHLLLKPMHVKQWWSSGEEYSLMTVPEWCLEFEKMSQKRDRFGF